MKNKRPILSICIPTYNRSVYLKQSLESLVSNKDFDDEVEIVISDNCSSDETESIGRDYANRFSNIKYFRNEENVRDTNFCLAMDRATGMYVKLMNDNTILLPDGISYMKQKIKDNLDEKPALFFTNNLFNHKEVGKYKLNSFEDFVVYLSFYVTAISVFGAWKEDWEIVVDRTRYTELRLNQDDWAYQIMENRGKGLLYVNPISTQLIIERQHRTGYNWFEVHVANYYTILQPYIDKKLISKKALSLEKKTYLKGLKREVVTCYLYNLHPDWDFDMSRTTSVLWKYFKKEPFFYFYMISMPVWGGIIIIKDLLKKGFLCLRLGVVQ